MSKEANLSACTKNGIIAALAMDQRNSLRSALEKASKIPKEYSDSDLEDFKSLVTEALSPYASAILLDPRYGLPAAGKRAKECGLLLAYEASGYDTNVPGRLPRLAEGWSVRRLVQAGMNAAKVLIYYNPQDPAAINTAKQVFVERVGAECSAEGVPLFLEILTYHDGLTGTELIRAKPELVTESVREFSQPHYRTDVLKIEFPIDPNATAGIGVRETLYSEAEAKAAFRNLDAAAGVPYIYLSAGVDMQVFARTLELAASSGSRYSGVLCGRATWKGAIAIYANDGAEAAQDWLATEGVGNIQQLNQVLSQSATPLNS
jgi:tagatose 1,6-diphosphate aldolase